MARTAAGVTAIGRRTRSAHCAGWGYRESLRLLVVLALAARPSLWLPPGRLRRWHKMSRQARGPAKSAGVRLRRRELAMCRVANARPPRRLNVTARPREKSDGRTHWWSRRRAIWCHRRHAGVVDHIAHGSGCVAIGRRRATDEASRWRARWTVVDMRLTAARHEAIAVVVRVGNVLRRKATAAICHHDRRAHARMRPEAASGWGAAAAAVRNAADGAAQTRRAQTCHIF